MPFSVCLRDIGERVLSEIGKSVLVTDWSTLSFAPLWMGSVHRSACQITKLGERVKVLLTLFDGGSVFLKFNIVLCGEPFLFLAFHA